MKVDAELNSEKSSVSGENGGQNQVCEPSVAGPLGSEVATPAAAGAVSEEGSLAADTRDEGQAKATTAQSAEPSVRVEKNWSAVETGRDKQVASSDAAPVNRLGDALAAL